MPPKRANSSTESLHTSKRLASDITDEQEPQIIPKTANKTGLLCRENRWACLVSRFWSILPKKFQPINRTMILGVDSIPYFNVNQPLELSIEVQRYFSEQKVQIEQFKDSPDHLHPIEDSEKLKCSEVVRELVMQEAVKNYRPPEIVSTVKRLQLKH
ncbi:unnamed protein product [Rhizophagus irregularis]|nr:unnamed protein product [Rhizophagus irregularis]